MLTRRNFLKKLSSATLLGIGCFSYAFAIEPALRLTVREWYVSPGGWPEDARRLRIAVLSDIHAFEPYMPAARIARIVAATNAMKPDLVVLLGDFVLKHPHVLMVRPAAIADWAVELAALHAPLGVFAILGNHDGHLDPNRVREGQGQAVDVPVLENRAIKVERQDHRFWLAGLGDQLTRYLDVYPSPASDDLPGTLAQVTDSDPLIMLAHEPNIFANSPPRVTLMLCGHTRGGQVWLPFYGSPGLGSTYDPRYLYGHIIEEERHMVVSAGLGISNVPIRFLVPPEITAVNVGSGWGLTHR